jgi:hypothetical protein
MEGNGHMLVEHGVIMCSAGTRACLSSKCSQALTPDMLDGTDHAVAAEGHAVAAAAVAAEDGKHSGCAEES